jgi:proton glutamate symport protein
MDMARTTINVVGNCLAAAVVARWEGQLGPIGVSAAPAVAHSHAADSMPRTGT